MQNLIDQALFFVREIIRPIVLEEISTFQFPPHQEKEPILVTQEEAAALYGVSKATLIRWGKLGLISFQKIKGRVYYNKAELLAAGKGHEKYKRKG